MNPKRVTGIWVWLAAVATAALSLSCGAASAQQTPVAAQRAAAASAGSIGSVRIDGIQRIEPETVRSYLLVQAGDPWDPDQRGAQHLVLELAQRADLRPRPAMFRFAHRHRLLSLRRTQRVLQHPTGRRRLGADLDVKGGRQPRPERVDPADDLGTPGGQRRLRFELDVDIRHPGHR